MGNSQLITRLSVLVFFASVGCATTIVTAPTKDGVTEYYTIVNDPESAFSIISKDIDTSQKVAADVTGKANVDVESQYKKTTQLLAEKLDQVNSQIYGMFKAALFGLNSNPTSKENRDKFWEAIRSINDGAFNLRKLAIIQSLEERIKSKEREIEQIRTEAVELTEALKSNGLSAASKMYSDELKERIFAVIPERPPMEPQVLLMEPPKNIPDYELKKMSRLPQLYVAKDRLAKEKQNLEMAVEKLLLDEAQNALKSDRNQQK